ncbi:MAG TPA: immunoglobulin domain-containing protein [Anaerohalosphaeraceae bacterium]|nr:immunoglobulin domain-containing protein [Anaerohalosphaeraceae bacterium]HPC63870.1 immunoglobulin domain-containing protein [Anaerohalosphaeraceae bacterium]HRS70545.1 immunoglobulin domain-containing protein [Anaerohalosphaeraceae bacterium]HRV19625.1 immunoglobulin domain-containing protein [Anaerohalosphaeraceae bacterium]
MRNCRKVWMTGVVVCLFAAFANAADLVSYTASGSPGSSPDANNGTVDVWAVTGDGGASRSFLKDMQDGNPYMWTIWDLDGGAGTYATHTFAGGPLTVGQSVSIDWAHNISIDNGTSIGIRLLNGSSPEVALVFLGGKIVYTRWDTGTGAYTDIAKYYDRYDIFQVVFTLTGPNSYEMTVSEGSIPDNPAGWGNNADDGNSNVGPIIDRWVGTFTGTAITGIQVYTEGGNDSDQWFDNLRIHEDWLKTAHAPMPSYKQEYVPVAGLELSWAIPQIRSSVNPQVMVADPNLVSFKLYYSCTDPNLNAASPIDVTVWDPQTLRAAYVPAQELQKNSTYRWRVDSVMNDNTARQGIEWIFYTEFSKPIILSHPGHQIIDAGGTAVFSVTVDSQSPTVYQWYRVAGGEDILLTDGGNISGTGTNTLAIADAGLDDEGYYFCVVNNESGIPAESIKAPLGIKRRIAYWPFENNVFGSSVAGSPHTIVVGDPNFVPAGILGNAVEFTDGVDMLFMDPEQNAYFDICNYEMTVACWVKTTDRQSWSPLVARNGEDGQGWQLRQSGFTNDRPCFTTRTPNDTDNDDGTPANRTIYDGIWHYVVGTYDGAVKKVYIDGVVSRLYSSDSGDVVRESDPVSGPIGSTGSPVSIAGRVRGNLTEGLNVELGSVVAGIYDEIEIYNYALDAETIAQKYADLAGTNVCLSQTYDLNNDCVVNLADLGLLASEWLNSRLFVPMP